MYHLRTTEEYIREPMQARRRTTETARRAAWIQKRREWNRAIAHCLLANKYLFRVVESGESWLGAR
jgi:hypothetical protein